MGIKWFNHDTLLYFLSVIGQNGSNSDSHLAGMSHILLHFVCSTTYTCERVFLNIHRSSAFVKRVWSVWCPSSSVWWSGAKTCMSIQTFKLTWVSVQCTVNMWGGGALYADWIWYKCVCDLFAGQEHPSDSDGGELKLPEQLAGRRDSISSLDSTVSSSVTASQADHPEQYEVIKQQKDIIEHGIELWAFFFFFLSLLMICLFTFKLCVLV